MGENQGACDAFFNSILSVNSFAHVEREILLPLAAVVRATSGVFVQFLGLPHGGESIGQLRQVGCGRRALAEYGDGLYALDPMVQPALRWMTSAEGPGGAVIGHLSDIADWRDRREYRRFLERSDIDDVLAIGLPVRTVLGPQCLCLGFHRGRGDEPFDERDVRALRQYLPVLQPVISNLVHRESAETSGLLLDTIVIAANVPGYLVLDEDLRVLHASQDARLRLGIDVAPGSRCDNRERNSFGELRMQLLRALRDDPPSESITLDGQHQSTRDSAEINLKVRPMRWLNGSNALLVTLHNGCGPHSFEHACREFELSSREREVALSACRGLQNSAIAGRLGITARTVENHLRSIYAKVGVSSRSQMVAQLLKLN